MSERKASFKDLMSNMSDSPSSDSPDPTSSPVALSTEAPIPGQYHPCLNASRARVLFAAARETTPDGKPANIFELYSRGFGRQSNKGNNPQKGNQSPTAYSPTTSTGSSMPPMPQSPAAQSATAYDPQQRTDQGNRRPPFFFREEYSNLIVKGNFMTLAARPQLVEEGEWMAHQVVEQYRLLEQMIDIVKVPDERTGRPICNPDVCPTMSASGHTYTWLDNNKQPIKIPAIQYINLVQKWIIGKINDPKIFPTDTSFNNPSSFPSGPSGASTPSTETPIRAPPTTLNTPISQLAKDEWLGKSSGFPENFESDIKSIYRQMMRCYAHLFHGHWLDPFWHLGSYKELNTCFIHFINVGRLFNLIGDKETEPMQPLIDLWLAKGLLPNHEAMLAAQATSAGLPPPTKAVDPAGQAVAPGGGAAPPTA